MIWDSIPKIFLEMLMVVLVDWLFFAGGDCYLRIVGDNQTLQTSRR